MATEFRIFYRAAQAPTPDFAEMRALLNAALRALSPSLRPWTVVEYQGAAEIFTLEADISREPRLAKIEACVGEDLLADQAISQVLAEVEASPRSIGKWEHFSAIPPSATVTGALLRVVVALGEKLELATFAEYR